MFQDHQGAAGVKRRPLSYRSVVLELRRKSDAGSRPESTTSPTSGALSPLHGQGGYCSASPHPLALSQATYLELRVAPQMY